MLVHVVHAHIFHMSIFFLKEPKGTKSHHCIIIVHITILGIYWFPLIILAVT